MEKRNLIKGILFLMVLFGGCLAVSVYAKAAEKEETYTLEVQYPFSGVKFYLYMEDEMISLGAQKTDEQGAAAFYGLVSGEYRIMGETHDVEGITYTPVASTVKIPLLEDSAGKKIIVKPKYEKEPVKDTEEPVPENVMPQTGHHWWLVSLFALSGLIMLLYGLLSKN